MCLALLEMPANHQQVIPAFFQLGKHFVDDQSVAQRRQGGQKFRPARASPTRAQVSSFWSPQDGVSALSSDRRKGCRGAGRPAT
jgi:hypothetical protein